MCNTERDDAIHKTEIDKANAKQNTLNILYIPNCYRLINF